MVLHRPVELAALIGQVVSPTKRRCPYLTLSGTIGTFFLITPRAQTKSLTTFPLLDNSEVGKQTTLMRKSLWRSFFSLAPLEFAEAPGLHLHHEGSFPLCI